jgi:predicted AlkP superfamily phosphohydrolase/phosphomutase
MAETAKVVVVGLDGLEPSIVERLLRSGELPHLAHLRARGGYRRLATTVPAQTPVAWSTFATGVNPGGHGIYDFLRRDPSTYRPDSALAHFERPSVLLPPRARNRRRGVAVWDRLTQAGIPATVLRCPGTFPPNEIQGRLLAGMGVPDLRGGFGTSTFFTTDPGVRAGDSEQVVTLRPAGGRYEGALPGPRDPRGGDFRLPLSLVPSATARDAMLHLGGGTGVRLDAGVWSEWQRVAFRTGPLTKTRGLVRFLLVRADEPIALYASPLNFDPRHPIYPISAPSEYGRELERALGAPFYTAGLVEDHTGLANERFGASQFLAQCELVMREREAMLMFELARLRHGLLFCLFDTPDRLQHMFWRHREPDHPANRERPLEPEYARAIEEHLVRCDAIVGRVVDGADDRTLIIVLSDHGFCSFQRSVHLNAWLESQGFLHHTTGGVDRAASFFRDVDWGRTKAYAVGFGGIFVNVKGREGEGSVPTSEADDVGRDIARRLSGLTDPQRGGAVAVTRARTRHELYRGPFVAEAPDVVVECAPGYRVSFETALGGVPEQTIDDNRRPWSGDHIVDAERVPGVLFLNRPFPDRPAAMLDLAPTILAALGAPSAPGLDGRNLLA